MSVAAPIFLGAGDESELSTLIRSSTVEAGLAQRARIVLLAAQGVSNTAIASMVGVSRPTVILWRNRYAQAGIAGLGDLERSGRPPVIGGLRRGDQAGSADGDGRLLDSDCFLVEVDVAAAQAGELPEPESAPGGEQHQESVPRGHGVGEGLHLGDSEESDVFRRDAGGGALDGDR